jgi:hypothetical protein
MRPLDNHEKTVRLTYFSPSRSRILEVLRRRGRGARPGDREARRLLARLSRLLAKMG